MTSAEIGVLAPVKALAIPDLTPTARAAKTAVDMAELCVIEDDDTYQLAAEDLQGIKGRWKRVEELRVSITGPMNVALRAVNALFKPAIDNFEQAESIYKRKMTGYQAKVRADAQRIQIENERRAHEARREAEAAAKRLSDEAAALTAAGNVAAAAEKAAESQAAEAEATIIVAAPPPLAVKVAGIGLRKTVDFEVESLTRLIIGVASNLTEHPEWAAYLKVDEVALRAQVRATGMATTIPGVRVFEKDGITVR